MRELVYRRSSGIQKWDCVVKTALVVLIHLKASLALIQSILLHVFTCQMNSLYFELACKVIWRIVILLLFLIRAFYLLCIAFLKGLALRLGNICEFTLPWYLYLGVDFSGSYKRTCGLFLVSSSQHHGGIFGDFIFISACFLYNKLIHFRVLMDD